MDPRAQHKQAQKLLSAGQPAAAVALYEELLIDGYGGQAGGSGWAQSSELAPQAHKWLEGAAQAYQAAGAPRLAAAIHVLRGDPAQAQALLHRDRDPLWLAHLVAAASPRAAAELFLRAGRPVHAAFAYAQPVAAGGSGAGAGPAVSDTAAARQCLAKVLEDPALARRLTPYARALLSYNDCALLHAAGAADAADAALRRDAVLAQQALEELADDFDRSGEAERALDCYQLLASLGELRGQFENLLEGELGQIRVLKAEHRPDEVLATYDALLGPCERAGEHLLSGTLCLEAADYAQRTALPGRERLLARAADAFTQAAIHHGAAGAPPQFVESAYLSAIAAHNRGDNFAGVRACWKALAALPLEPARQERYRRLAGRYADVPARPATPAAAPPQPDAPRTAAAAVARVDLEEWETGGDPVETGLRLLCDTRRPMLTRQHALLIVLLAGREPPATRPLPGGRVAKAPEPLDAPGRRQLLLHSLGSLRCYEALRPLERQFDDAAPPVAGRKHSRAHADIRRLVMTALPRLPYKRSLHLLTRGLFDSDAAVRGAALDALTRMTFPDAVAPLVRLFHTAQTQDTTPEIKAEVRLAVLRSLARAHDPRAVRLLREAARREPEPLRSEAARLVTLQPAASGAEDDQIQRSGPV